MKQKFKESQLKKWHQHFIYSLWLRKKNRLEKILLEINIIIEVEQQVWMKGIVGVRKAWIDEFDVEVVYWLCRNRR